MQVFYLYAVMQIIFESLPVSSSGNVMLWIPVLQNILRLPASENGIPDFDFLLHIPTIFIIGVFFFSVWFPFARNIQRGFTAASNAITCCVLADTMTVLFYYLWKLLGVDFFPLWLGFACTTLLLFSLTLAPLTFDNKRLRPFDAVILGVVQGCALLPGISRLASTFVAGVWLGYAPTQSFRYSLFFQLPLLGAACVQGLWHLKNLDQWGVFEQPEFYVVVLIASVVSFCLLGRVSVMVKQNIVWQFAWYTAFLSVLALVLN